MLITVREEQLKIAMGLLSYLPEYRDVSTTQREIDWYQNNNSRNLLLWQDPVDHHYLAMIGIEFIFNEIVVRQLVFGVEVSPKERWGLRKEIFDMLSRQNQAKVLMGTIKTQHVVNEWRRAKING